LQDSRASKNGRTGTNAYFAFCRIGRIIIFKIILKPADFRGRLQQIRPLHEGEDISSQPPLTPTFFFRCLPRPGDGITLATLIIG